MAQQTKSSAKSNPQPQGGGGAAAGGDKGQLSGVAAQMESAQQGFSHLVDVGGRFAYEKLTAFWELVKPKISNYARFGRFGFDPAWVALMDTMAKDLADDRTVTAEEKDATVPTGHELDAEMGAAKDWRRDAWTTLSISAEHGKRTVHTATGSSVPALIRALTDLLPVIGAAGLAGKGGGPAVAQEGQAILDRLEAAAATHGNAVGNIGAAVRLFNAKKGVFYEELRRLARTARRVAPAEAKLFAPSTHVRTPPSSKRAPAPPSTASSGTHA